MLQHWLFILFIFLIPVRREYPNTEIIMNTRIHLTNAFKVITLLSLNTHNAFAGGTEKSRYSSNTPASHNHGAHDHSSHHSSAHTSSHSGADAPIGVMGDHMHGAGEWMFSLRQIKMEMSGNKIGSDNASDTEILSIANTKLRKRKDRMTEYSASLLWTPKTIEQSIMVPQLELDVFHKKIKSTFPNF